MDLDLVPMLDLIRFGHFLLGRLWPIEANKMRSMLEAYKGKEGKRIHHLQNCLLVTDLRRW